MADKGIIFSAAMVRALLDGRKTQTRRLVNPQPAATIAKEKRVDHVGDYCTGAPKHGQAYYWRENGCWNSSERFNLPYAPGDRLYVREAWHVRGCFTDVVEVGYRASENRGHTEYVEQVPVEKAVPGKGKWPEYPSYGPSIHMPRWASRLTLTVTEVRVQRLQEISEEDARAEGLQFANWEVKSGGDMEYCEGWSSDRFHAFKHGVGETAREGFELLWNSLHNKADERWRDNPWIVVPTFDVRRGNIDAVPV